MLRAMLLACGLIFGLGACVSVPPADAAPSAINGPRPVPTGVQRWTIAGDLADCVGVAPMKCMRYQERPGGPWLFFYGPIEGFTFREGEEADVEVRYVPVPRPAADASSHRVLLVRELARRPATMSSLSGSDWQLMGMSGHNAPAEALSAISMMFDGAGRVSGHSGVNRFSAQAQMQGSTLRLAAPVSTRMAGSPEAMARESEFLGRLSRVAAWRISGDRLLLSDQAGTELLAFRRAPSGR
jgi:heat shock protein HslJ